MTVDEHPTESKPSAARGFRPSARRRTRIALGALLATVAIGGNVLLYSSLDDSIAVLQLVDNVRAGELLTADDLRVVEVELDPTVPHLPADQIDLVVSRYARVYLASGSLVSADFVQGEPLVAADSGVVAVEIRPARVPAGLVERSRVLVVVKSDGERPEFVTTGRVIARAGELDSVSGVASLSVEVSLEDAPRIAAGDDIRLALLDPATDPARLVGVGDR